MCTHGAQLLAMNFNLEPFQVIDDILDVTQSSKTLGKSAGKDEAVNKATYPAIHGLDESRRLAEKLTKQAINALKPFKSKGKSRCKCCSGF